MFVTNLKKRTCTLPPCPQGVRKTDWAYQCARKRVAKQKAQKQISDQVQGSDSEQQSELDANDMELERLS